MVKTIKFGDKEIKFSTCFAWAFIYKSQFKADPAKYLIPAIRRMSMADMDEDAQAMAMYEELGFVGIVQIAWSMATLCDQSIAEPMEWVESFGDDFGAFDLVLELIPEAIESCFSSKNLVAPTPEQKDEEQTTAEEEEKEQTPKK